MVKKLLMFLYKAVRMMIVTLLGGAVILFAALYITLSIPSVQDKIRTIGEEELSKLLKADVHIGKVTVSPIREVVLKDVFVPDQQGDSLLYVQELGAGVSLYSLVANQRLVFTYGEVMGMKGRINKPSKDSPLNIQFIIDALSSKDKTKPPTRFDVKIYNLVIRKSAVSYDVLDQPRKEGRFDANHIAISNLRADVAVPKLRNNDFDIEVKRISFAESCGFNLKNLATHAKINDSLVALLGTRIELENSYVGIDSIGVGITGLANLGKDIKTSPIDLEMANVYITPSDLKCFVPALAKLDDRYNITVKARGNSSAVNVSSLYVRSEESGIGVELRGKLSHLNKKEEIELEVPHIVVKANAHDITKLTSSFTKLTPQATKIVRSLGNVKIDGSAYGSAKNIQFDGDVNTSLGSLSIDAKIAGAKNAAKTFNGKVATDKFRLGYLLGKEDLLGDLALNAEIDASLNGKEYEGKLKGLVPFVDVKGYRYKNIDADVYVDNEVVDGVVAVGDANCDLELMGTFKRAGEDSDVDANIVVNNLNLAALNLTKKHADKNMSFVATANMQGNKLDNLNGELQIKDFVFEDSVHSGLHINNLSLVAMNDSVPQRINIESDFLHGNIVGSYDFVSLVPAMKNIVAKALPSLVKGNEDYVSAGKKNKFKFDFVLNTQEELQSMFKLPVNNLDDVVIKGEVDEGQETFMATIDAPYLQQGNKIVESTTVKALKRSREPNVQLVAQTIFPMKKGKTHAYLNINGVNDRVDTDLSWKIDHDRQYTGMLDFSTLFVRDADNKLGLNVDINPTEIVFNDTVWSIKPAKVLYDKGVITVNNLRGECDHQMVKIDGSVSKNPADVLMVELKDMSLDYVFEVLAIDNVKFGGVATGKFYASNLLSGAPILETPNLHVENIAYNNCRMGNADIKSNWENETKGINILADIKQTNGLKSIIDCEIYPTRDSLSVNFDAHKAEIGFLQPFMSAISSDVRGQVSGKALLYGTFKNMNLTGDVYADQLIFKVDFTNVYYTANDSVHISPGYIGFDNIRLTDREGNSAKLNGWLRHDFFHRPEFEFSISDARNFLCYDTNSTINPDWYGTMYGNGTATVKGGPGICEIGVNMETCDRSKFTFVLSDEVAANEYDFITFVDRNKTEKVEDDGIPQKVKDLLAKNIKKSSSQPSIFRIDIQADITNVAQLTVVMDPVGGDKIRGYGAGNMRLTYDSTDESLGMYGKYELEKGNYNFTLQDIILKDFTINSGSSISFNGDPYAANLNINATYSLNANLLDLDESFASDRELNRTNVPVNAILKAQGDMRQPDISFDLDFPTISADAARKVKSIVSTDDLMNRQIIYLLALNRFYTPEYMMGSTNRNNELASVASSTLSSQLSNMLGQLSENWSISPNFRSDIGDFSDVEVDLALSSQLLNNRLLFNGNFGYRDNRMNNRNSNFIGDFDIEYLLNRRGTVRLKAYNHFNDQNYYVRSAMTTQGVGVEFKFDFENPFIKPRSVVKATNEVEDSTRHAVRSRKEEVDSVKNGVAQPKR